MFCLPANYKAQPCRSNIGQYPFPPLLHTNKYIQWLYKGLDFRIQHIDWWNVLNVFGVWGNGLWTLKRPGIPDLKLLKAYLADKFSKLCKFIDLESSPPSKIPFCRHCGSPSLLDNAQTSEKKGFLFLRSGLYLVRHESGSSVCFGVNGK